MRVLDFLLIKKKSYKTENILIKNGIIKISDFDICYFLDENEDEIEDRTTLPIEQIGTRGSIPPEGVGCRAEDIDWRFDIYCLFLIILGRNKF